MCITRIICAIVIFTCYVKGKQTQMATFFRDGSIYNAAKIPIISTMDQIKLNFKTKQDNSYIFHIGAQPTNLERGLQYLLVYLDNRQLTVQLKHDQIVDATFKVTCVSIYSSCADNHWHSISISRKKDTKTRSYGELIIKIMVDGVLVLDKVVGDVFSQLLSQYIVFGSSIPLMNTSDKTKFDMPSNLRNYRGCFRKIIYTTDNLEIDILSQAKSKRHFLTNGEIYFDKCSDLFPIESIAFLSEPAYVTLNGWVWGQKGTLQFTFKTTEPDSLLAYQKSESFQYNQFDFYAFEIRNSYLHFSINTGSGAFSQPVSTVTVSDGVNHYVKMWFENGKIEVQLDAEKKLEHTNHLYRVLDITEDLYLGGVSENLLSFIPHSIWSGILRQGFVGCLIDISVNGVQYDLALKVQSENISGISIGCADKNSDKNFCENKPCADGICSLGYNRYICDCTRTNYTGRTCDKVAPLVKFNGFQSMIITMPPGFQSECEDITLRFLTTRPNGVLIITRSLVSGAPDKIKVYVENGQLEVLVNFGKGNKFIKTSINVFDGKWHTLKLKRRQLNLSFSVDDFEIKNNISGTSKLLTNDIINIGRYKTGKDDMFFTGFMMHFIFNGINYFEMAKKESPSNIEVTATIDNAELAKEFPISFQSSSSYLRLPRINMYGDFKLEFFIKTKSISGNILQLFGTSGDYLILRIVSGFLNLIFNWGNGYNKKLNKEIRIDDNKWHRILLVRENSNSNAFAFRIDGEPRGSEANIPLQSGGINFNSFEDLFLGSADKYTMKHVKLKDKITSKNGFHGCIASFYMNHTKLVLQQSIYQNLLSISTAINGVIEGCEEELLYKVNCEANTCHSSGRCIQQWTQVRCDCSMTSYSGERCDQVGKTLKFNEYPAYLILKLSPSRNTTLDELAFGIQTSILTSTPIILIEGDGRQPDFITAKLQKDKGRSILVIEYNMGSGISRLMEPAVNVADGFYHRVAFRRSGKVSSLQIDDLRPKFLTPSGKTSVHFNHQRTIYVGRTPYSTDRAKRSLESESNAFSGYLSGLYFNRIPLGNMMSNISYAGIKLLNSSNVYVETKFIPNIKQKSQKSSILSEQEVMRDNDQMQKNTPIIVGRRKCLNLDTLPPSECQTANGRGIVRLNLSYVNNSVNISPENTTQVSNEIVTQNYFHTVGEDLMTVKKDATGTINIGLIIGFSLGGSVLLVLITCFIYRCCRQDEGSYNVEEDRVFFDPTCKPLKNGMELNNNNLVLSDSSYNSSKHKPLRRDKKSDAKEWYV